MSGGRTARWTSLLGVDSATVRLLLFPPTIQVDLPRNAVAWADNAAVRGGGVDSAVCVATDNDHPRFHGSLSRGTHVRAVQWIALPCRCDFGAVLSHQTRHGQLALTI